MKKTLLILGAGTAGTILASKLRRKLALEVWRIIIIDKEPDHYYQSGYLGLVFGQISSNQVCKPKQKFIPDGVELIFAEVEAILPDESRVVLRPDDRSISYDQLVIATGSDIYPEENPGLLGEGWQNSIFDFYTYSGAEQLRHTLQTWQGGRLVLNVAEMPVKCPAAPLEFLFLADDYFQEAGLRNKVELVYAFPSAEIFTRPEVVPVFNGLIDKKNVFVHTDFYLKQVDPEKKVLQSYTGETLDYDLLVTIPTNMGAKAIGRSDIGSEFRYVPVNAYSLQSEAAENIWVIGDAADLPCPKTASAIHGMVATVAENILRLDAGKPIQQTFDGETKCLIELGGKQGLLLAFSYMQPPKPGKYPLPGIGPFTVLSPTRANYLGKLGLLWVYWNLFLPARYAPARYTRVE